MTNTIEISRRLQHAGLPAPHADAIAESQAEMIQSETATKADLLELIGSVRLELEKNSNEIKRLRTEFRLACGFGASALAVIIGMLTRLIIR